MRRTRAEQFDEGIRQGYRRGYERGYLDALEEMKTTLTGGRRQLEWEDMRNGKVYTRTEEDQA